MADDGHGGDRVLVQAGRKIRQHIRKVGLDGRLAHVKRNVARNVQLQAVVLGLAHGHASASSGAFHGDLLVLHLFRPDVATARTQRTAQNGTLCRPFRAACGRTQQRPQARTNARALR